MKGGSDATTNLFWRCKAVLPYKTSQTTAVGRMLLLCAVWVHRLYQIASMSGRSSSTSLCAWRNKAQKRSSFKKTLFRIVKAALKEVREHGVVIPATETTDESPFVDVTVNQIITRNRPQTAPTPNVNMGGMTTGATPIRNIKKRLSQEPTTGPERAVCARNEKCVGCVGIKKKNEKADPTRGLCVTCKSPTNGWCIMCRQRLCTGLSKKQQDNASWPNGVILRAPGQEDEYYVNTCFFAKHLAAVKAATGVMAVEMRDALALAPTGI